MTDPNRANNTESGQQPNTPQRVQATKQQWIYVGGSLIAFIAVMAIVASI